jgi:hypothetical protein
MAMAVPQLPLPACGERSDREAVRVRGALLAQSFHDHFQHSVRVLRHIIVPETEYPIIVLSQPFIPHPIPFAFVVLTAVDYDHQPTFAANKVDSDRSTPAART